MRTIYTLIDPITGNPKYVGQTSRDIKLRIQEHFKNRENPSLPIHKWIKEMIDIGLRKYLTFQVLETVNESSWKLRERFWIKELSYKFELLNGTMGGDGFMERHHSEETRNKIRNKRKMQTFSELTRKKLSLARIGNQHAKGAHYKRNPNDLKNTWETRRLNGTDKGYHFKRNPEDLKKSWATRRLKNKDKNK